MNLKWLREKKREMAIDRFVYKELSKSLFLFDPLYFTNGQITKANLKKLKESGTIPIISVDRNVLSDLLTAVKKGSFSSCKNRKEVTAFLFWVEKNDFLLSPYDALYEQAYLQKDTPSGNKEMDLFNFLFDKVGIDVVKNSFFDEGICFEGKKFTEACDSKQLNFNADNPDFLFLYATMLHLVYELKSGKSVENQFFDMIEWYFSEALISIYALTYIVLLFCKDGITPPHKYMDDKEAIKGCKNEAMDLLYMQELDPRRYPSRDLSFIMATHDIVMRDVFCTVFDKSDIKVVEEYLCYLCSYAPREKQNKYQEKLLECLRKHKEIGVTPFNALEIAKKMVQKEEKRLSDILIG